MFIHTPTEGETTDSYRERFAYQLFNLDEHFLRALCLLIGFWGSWKCHKYTVSGLDVMLVSKEPAQYGIHQVHCDLRIKSFVQPVQN